MNQPLRLMAVLAHPDDESLGTGGTLAYYATRGVETYVVSATRGEAGRFFENQPRPSNEEVGRVREQELHAAARELGVHEVVILDYKDKELDQVDPFEAVSRIVREVRRVRPHVVITFPPDGAYGHPDHIATSQLTNAAMVAAEDPAFTPELQPHRVSKLYYIGWPQRIWDLYQLVFKKFVSTVDGVERQVQPWPDWLLSTRIDATAHWQTVWRAIQSHKTQMSMYRNLDRLTPEQHAILWGDQHFYRAFSFVNGGRQIETDLFDGIR
jgi:LmbE family N-acetylglucosaminyl deacetylase